MADAKMKLSMNIKELTDIQIDIVWNPPWGKDRMSRYAKIALGFKNNNIVKKTLGVNSSVFL